jgi:sterol desaturase/sphingolipid hydroxylase (fatty acid hydroxylase superfamily)
MSPSELLIKQQQFADAMVAYNKTRRYQVFSMGVAVINILLQTWLLIQLFPLLGSLSLIQGLLALGLILYLTDLINGFVHMLMDNYGGYTGLAGPLVANFHLHHKTPVYKKRPLLVVYFLETGSKIWLVAYLGIIIGLFSTLSPLMATILVGIGIFSSIAEVSHYLCHTSRSALVSLLMKSGLLMSKKHHAKHHTKDNMNYAFLNGWSDPLLNRMAASLFSGYKKGTDQHFAAYEAGLESLRDAR